MLDVANADQQDASREIVRKNEALLAVRQGFEPWIQLLGRITV
jgi:hypothetical protein